MVVLTILFGALMSLLLFTTLINDKETRLAGYFTGCIFASLFALSLYDILDSTPNALDVYRGKTELEITSVNGVPQDTVVVFKKEFKKK